MSRSTRSSTLAVLLAVSLAAQPSGAIAAPLPAQAAVASIPERLSDAEFWSLVSEVSEPGGYFRITDNYTSNEREVGQVFTMLRERGVDGRRLPRRRTRAEPDVHRSHPSRDGVHGATSAGRR